MCFSKIPTLSCEPFMWWLARGRAFGRSLGYRIKTSVGFVRGFITEMLPPSRHKRIQQEDIVNQETGPRRSLAASTLLVDFPISRMQRNRALSLNTPHLCYYSCSSHSELRQFFVVLVLGFALFSSELRDWEYEWEDAAFLFVRMDFSLGRWYILPQHEQHRVGFMLILYPQKEQNLMTGSINMKITHRRWLAGGWDTAKQLWRACPQMSTD